MRNFIIGALSVGALYLLYMAYKKSQESKELSDSKMKEPKVEAPKEPPFACPEGEILCAKKEKTCYNPMAKYIVDPCI